MSDNLQKSKLQQILALVQNRLAAIKALQKEVPPLEEAKEELEWMLKSEEFAPEVTFAFPSEKVLFHLDNLEHYLVDNHMPLPDPMGSNIILASGTASSSDYADHVIEFQAHFPDNEDVSKWAIFVVDSYNELREYQNRSEQVNQRLDKLSGKLQELHSRASDAALSAAASVQSPIEGAELLRELLVSFKGELIRRCKSGKKTDYHRIADNLAISSPATIDAIINQEQIYDNLHHELAEIAKGRLDVRENRLKELLSNLEDHVLIITDSIDPEKIGIVFI